MCMWEVKMAIDLLAWVSCPSAPSRRDSGACSRAASRASARSVSLSHADPVRCLGKSRSSVLSSLLCPRCLTSLALSLSFFSATEWQRNRNRSRAAVSGHLARETSSRACRFLPSADYRFWRHGVTHEGRGVWYLKTPQKFARVSLCEAERLGDPRARAVRGSETGCDVWSAWEIQGERRRWLGKPARRQNSQSAFVFKRFLLVLNVRFAIYSR